jgi:hypothetical protein
MAKNRKSGSSRTGGFRDSIHVRNSRSGTQYVRAIDVILSDKAASKMKRAGEVVRSSETTTSVNNTVSSSKKK